MLTKRNKATERRKATERFARKNRLIRRRLGLEIGDRVQIIDIDSCLKDPSYDANVKPELRDMRTGELFRFCLGREFTVQNFGRYGTVELDAGANRAVRQEFGRHHAIWLEPEQLEVVRKRRTTKRRATIR